MSMDRSELVVFASASEVTYPAVLSNGTRMTGSDCGGNGRMQPGVPDVLSGTTASESGAIRQEEAKRALPSYGGAADAHVSPALEGLGIRSGEHNVLGAAWRERKRVRGNVPSALDRSVERQAIIPEEREGDLGRICRASGSST